VAATLLLLTSVLAGCSISVTNSLPTATAGGEVVTYAGTAGTGVTIVGKTQNEPKVNIAQGAPKPTKLIKTDLVIGAGDVATVNSNVTVSYIGLNFTSGKVFNNTYATGQTVPFVVNQTIPGWMQGIPGMRVGGVRALSVPTALAYANQPPDVSVAGPLVFVVELQSTS
jgi:peptidylprolyl isomerase